ncbi:hypothetical protein MY7_0441 [Bacillus sp. 5B6]|nr:hypothetical protein MY7_0441 [Bacillus sp. 5B6]
MSSVFYFFSKSFSRPHLLYTLLRICKVFFQKIIFSFVVIALFISDV